MIKTDKGNVHIEGLSIEIMADFRVICRVLRKNFVENFGEEDGNKISMHYLLKIQKNQVQTLPKLFLNLSMKSRIKRKRLRKRNLMKKSRQQVIHC